ncbi:hypothetical protein [Psychroserpens burtonensis]|uniref:hypothetical protein n=1 Tax=Psychroserpens burtonensis TaxID=49278 RepID=UPI00042831C1|nr:hypothetical protein [Psychroserpens burtonensis]
MKKALFILALAFSMQLSAQDKNNWITDYKVALELSKTQEMPILAFVTDNQKTEASEILNQVFFSSEAYKNIASQVILLKVDISDSQSYNTRLGIHYLNKRSTQGLALVNQYNDKIGAPLTDFSAENIKSFLFFINSKL